MNEADHHHCGGVSNRTVPLVGLSLIALAGMIAALWVTRNGAGLFADSFTYISGAENLRAGPGYYTNDIRGGFLPIVHYPPLLSSVLAVLGFLGIDSYSGCRWLNALAAGVNIWLTGYIAGVYLKVPPLGVVFACLYLLLSCQFLWIHTMVMSEPLFLCLSLLGLLFLLRQLKTPSVRTLLASTAFFSLALMTRHFGVPLLAAGALSLLVLEPRPLRQRLIHTMILVGAAATPYLLFLLRNRIVSGQATIVGPHHIHLPSGFISNVLDVLANSLALSHPNFLNFRPITKVLMGCGGVGFLIMLSWHLARLGPARCGAYMGHSAPAVVLIVIACYVCFYVLVTATLTADFALPYHMSRALIPLLPFVVLLLAGLLSESLRSTLKGRTTSITTAATIAFLLLSTLKLGWSAAYYAGKDGQGYATSTWRSSETLAFIKTLPQNGVFFSNDPSPFHFYAGRDARYLPEIYQIMQGHDASPASYQSQLNAVKNDLEDHGGWIVYLNQSVNKQIVPADRLEKELPIKVVRMLPDGIVYNLVK